MIYTAPVGTIVAYLGLRAFISIRVNSCAIPLVYDRLLPFTSFPLLLAFASRRFRCRKVRDRVARTAVAFSGEVLTGSLRLCLVSVPLRLRFYEDNARHLGEMLRLVDLPAVVLGQVTVWQLSLHRVDLVVTFVADFGGLI